MINQYKTKCDASILDNPEPCDATKGIIGYLQTEYTNNYKILDVFEYVADAGGKMILVITKRIK